ncbi:MAG: CapA family protein [Bacteroidales bacterium]|nr:CapA family protein [Bacteroidales bacterium]
MRKGLCCLLLYMTLAAGARVVLERPLPPARALLPEQDTVSMVIIGDVMMHARQLQYNHREFLRLVAPRLQEADLAVANMEFPMAGPPYTGYPSFSTPDEYAAYLADCGVDVFLLGNNHVLDREAAGLRRTLRVYDELQQTRGTRYTGAAADPEALKKNHPLVIFRRGMRIALVNFTYGTNNGGVPDWPHINLMHRDEVRTAIEEARAAGADFVVALPHWGEEYQLRHSRSQEEWARWLVSCGVDAIVGSHPHVVQDSTHINGVPVFYSLGNAVSNMSARNTQLELAVTLRFVRNNRTREVRLLEPEAEWMWCSLPGHFSDNYTTLFIEEWTGRRSDWSIPKDYDNMLETLRRVSAATGIGL